MLNKAVAVKGRNSDLFLLIDCAQADEKISQEIGSIRDQLKDHFKMNGVELQIKNPKTSSMLQVQRKLADEGIVIKSVKGDSDGESNYEVIDRTIRKNEPIRSESGIIVLGDIEEEAQVYAKGPIYCFGEIKGAAQSKSGEVHSWVGGIKQSPGIYNKRLKKIIGSGK